jgi:hypothetical protein
MGMFSSKRNSEPTPAEKAAAQARTNRRMEAWDDWEFCAHTPAEKRRALAVVAAIERNDPRGGQ